MKKIHILGLLLIGTFLLVTSCKEVKKEAAQKEDNFKLDTANTTISWIAYKTTEKMPVKGIFDEVTVDEKSGTTVKEALNDLKFSIPISSLQTKDTIRDEKLKKFFFGSMVNTAEITGILHLKDDTTGTADITMNAVSYALPISYTITNNTVNIEATMNLDNWMAQAAVEALNAACFDLHKGADGVSKTWSEVKIEIIANVVKK